MGGRRRDRLRLPVLARLERATPRGRSATAEDQPRGAFDTLRFSVVHDYMQSLARVCVKAGLDRNRIYTHVVAIGTAHPEAIGGSVPPVWVAVNPYSVPGFTLDNRGAAVYNLAVLKSQVGAAGRRTQGFAAIETYLAHDRDERSFAASLSEIFDHGGTIKVLFGPFQKDTPFALDPRPEGATLAILKWLKAP